MSKTIKFLYYLAIGVAIIISWPAQAKDAGQVTDWYVKNFNATITVNSDSSLLIEEKIIADCGNLPDKHGIFRVLPTQTKTENQTFKTPIELVSITDFDGKPINYSQSKNNFDHTVTWKIGDANTAVSGENDYKIIYKVKNAVRSGNADFDELYWNILGNFWKIDIENFGADIIFPDNINKNNSEIYLYSGDTGQKGNPLANYEWAGDNVLRIISTKTILPKQGITASIIFPKGIIAPYQPDFFELYGDYLWLLITLLVFTFSFLVWNKYGKDPKVNKTIIPEFEIPENLTPLEMGMLISQGKLKNEHISAAIIGLAVNKQIVIEEIPKQGIFGARDFRFKKTGQNQNKNDQNPPEEMLMESILGSNQEILLSELKKGFYNHIPAIKKTAIESLKAKNLIYQGGLTLKNIFLAGAIIMMFAAFAIAGAQNLFAITAFAISAAILLVFGLLMPKRTPKGAELNWRIKGFKLYMETAEKYRVRFYEKENIFEKFLPYAIMFGIAKMWTKKMEEIYGKEYFANYHPAWYVGGISGGFDAGNFSSQINSISAGIAANMGASSGAGGGGGVGGGAGGGGGVGW